MSGQQEVGLAQFLNDADLCGYAFGLMRMVAADYDGEISLADALADSRAPVFVERLVDRPVGDAEGGLWQFGLPDKRVSQLFVVVEVKADEGSFLGHIGVSFF